MAKKRTKDKQGTKDKARRGVAPCWALAQKIATAILTAWDKDGGTECTRVQLMLSEPFVTERIMGGRCKASLAQCIAEELESAGWPNVMDDGRRTQATADTPTKL